jgi:hypothetical protein
MTMKPALKTGIKQGYDHRRPPRKLVEFSAQGFSMVTASIPPVMLMIIKPGKLPWNEMVVN